MGKLCKNCGRQNHFAKRSQLVNQSTEEVENSENECDLIQNFDSRDEFEIMSTKPGIKPLGNNEQYIHH